MYPIYGISHSGIPRRMCLSGPPTKRLTTATMLSWLHRGQPTSLSVKVSALRCCTHLPMCLQMMNFSVLCIFSFCRTHTYTHTNSWVGPCVLLVCTALCVQCWHGQWCLWTFTGTAVWGGLLWWCATAAMCWAISSPAANPVNPSLFRLQLHLFYYITIFNVSGTPQMHTLV